jgi:biotin carboxyl carrier protein
MGTSSGDTKKMKYVAEVDGLEFPLEIIDEHHVRFGEEVLEVDLAAVSGQPLYSLVVNHESYEGYVYPDEENWEVHLLGHLFQVHVEDERETHLRISSREISASGMEFILKAPMPGLVIDVKVVAGQMVDKGDTLVLLESMKMQNELRAPFSGKISSVSVKLGDSVQQKQILLTVISARLAEEN